ncbi:MAG: zf-HC2 domain-containing protein [Acidimicrobiales bacterium]
MMAAADNSLLHDQALVDQARHGDRYAFDALYQRLGPATWRFALAVTRDPSVAAGAVAAAFASTLGAAPDTAANIPVRAQLLAAARHAAFDPALQPIAVGVDAAPAASPVRDAFAALPERWRSALWVVVAERLPTHEAGPALGLPAAAVTPLAMRAHAGLREQIVGTYAEAADDDKCRHAAERLVDYGAGRLATRESNRVRKHLDGCERCQGLLAELDDVTPSLRAALPLPIGVAAISESRWRAALVHSVGPLGLTFNGRPVPAWVERTVAGAAAAVIALGISSAVLVAGRGGRVRDDGLARSVTAESSLGDGESAAGGSVDFDGSLPKPTSTTAADGGGVFRPVERAVAPVADIPTPEVVAPTPVAPTTPAPSAPAAPTTPVEPAIEVTVAVDGVLGLTVGDQCTGLELAGTVIGCEPATTGAPLDVITEGSLLNSLGL